GDLLPPDIRRAAAVVDHHHLVGARAGLLDPGLVRLADIDPQLDVAGIAAPGQRRLALLAQAAAELQPLIGVQRERHQPHHQPGIGLGGMLGQGEVVGGVIVPVHVADLELGFDHGGVEGHGEPLERRGLPLYVTMSRWPALPRPYRGPQRKDTMSKLDYFAAAPAAMKAWMAASAKINASLDPALVRLVEIRT